MDIEFTSFALDLIALDSGHLNDILEILEVKTLKFKCLINP